jgi:ABC-2 type transport system permease protein
MFATIAAEFRKIFSVRSTYILSVLSILFLSAISFWFVGYKADPQTAFNANVVSAELLSDVQFFALFGAIIAILSITHEYRYNTIMYTLTASNSRTKVLLAKLLTTTVVSVVYAAIGLACAVSMVLLGMHMAGINVLHQYVEWHDILWRLAVYVVGYSIAGLLFGLFMRNVAGAITTILLLPATIENLLALVFKDNAVYLPFTALNGVVRTSLQHGDLSHPKAASVFAIYAVVGGLVAWFLFLRRDATN